MAEVTPRPATGAAAPARVFDHAVQVRPYGNLRVSGDVGVVIEQDAGVFVAMVDVLGHGHVAATTARRIDSLLRTFPVCRCVTSPRSSPRCTRR